MFKKLIILSFLFFSIVGYADDRKNQPKHMAFINNVSFHEAKFDKENAGNGFIVRVKDNDYAVTAKHILMIAKTDKMKFVGVTEELKQWKMFNKNNDSQYLIVDQLLNANKSEKLQWETLSNDWIVFSIKENNSGYKPLKFRTKPLTKGEKLFVVGWSYQDKEGPQRTYEFEFDETKDGLHTLIQIKGPESLAGLSGSPIIDANNKVIGLVSTGWQDEKTNITYLQASKGSDINHFIEEYSKNSLNK